mgnify:CR=1 FL=1
MNYYRNDPYWTKSKFTRNCMTRNCGHLIRKGERVCYFPTGRATFCKTCGEAEYSRFLSAAGDECGTPYAS